MYHCVRPPCLEQKYCSLVPPLSAHYCHSVITHPQPACSTCTVTAHSCVTHSLPHRCPCGMHYPHPASVSCRKVEAAFTCLSPLMVNTTVLAQRRHDGFYYLANLKQEEEPGVFLIEFNKPGGDRYRTMLQKTEAKDLIQYLDALRRCIVPGDMVLAPWEPGQVRYGPGTVILGLETRDPLRASEDEELTVSFWNGKKARVPLGVAVQISPSVFRRIVDQLHQPISSQQTFQDRDPKTTTYAFTDRITTAPTLQYLPSQHHLHNWQYHSNTHQHCSCCCFPNHQSCTCCHDPKCQEWWPLSPTVYVQGKREQGRNEETFSSTRGRERPQREKSPQLSTSSESVSDESFDEDDGDSDQETWLSKTTQSTMVDSGVNTDSSLWDKPRMDISDRPDWRYWKRSQAEPFYRKPGLKGNRSKSAASKSRPGAPCPDSFDSTNQNALFETIRDSPIRRLTIKDVLVHTDFNPSDKPQAPPVAERLGQSEVEKLRKKKIMLEKHKEKKMKHCEWEAKREQNADQKYSESQEVHRGLTLQRLRKEDLKVKEQEARNTQNIKTKKAARESHDLRLQTLAAEEKQKEQRRLHHLRNIREKIDQREFEKCATNEQREINHVEAQRRKVNNHYRQVAEKVLQAEHEPQSGSRKALSFQAEI
ncbi:uncharacterized protein C11orf16 homolog [Pelodytes ibericus]